MLKFEETLEVFLNELKSYKGYVPEIKIDFNNENIVIKKSASGLLHKLYQNDRFIGHLKEDGIHVKFIENQIA